MHNIYGRLTLYTVNRSTRLSSFHSTGYVDKKGRISSSFRILLSNNNFTPVYGKILNCDYYSQPFFYLSCDYLNLFNRKLDLNLINSLQIK